MRIFSASGCVLLSMFASTSQAKAFRAWAKQVLAARLAPSAAEPPLQSTLDSLNAHMATLALRVTQPWRAVRLGFADSSQPTGSSR